MLATQFGYHALQLLMAGQANRLVVLRDGKIGSVPITDIAGKIRTVQPDDPLMAAARAVGTTFGD